MSIDNNDDMIDSRDVIDRIAEMESEAVSRYANGREDLSYGELANLDHCAYLDEDEAAELRALRELAEQGEGLADWQHGETLIRDSYFTEYAQELAEDIGAVKSDAGWPAYCIDWERAARDLQMDYTSLEFDGVTYWARS